MNPWLNTVSSTRAVSIHKPLRDKGIFDTPEDAWSGISYCWLNPFSFCRTDTFSLVMCTSDGAQWGSEVFLRVAEPCRCVVHTCDLAWLSRPMLTINNWLIGVPSAPSTKMSKLGRMNRLPRLHWQLVLPRICLVPTKLLPQQQPLTMNLQIDGDSGLGRDQVPT